MSGNGAVLLISDRPDQSRELARRLGNLCACRTIGLYEKLCIPVLASVVVTDVGLRHAPDVKRLRHLLSQPHALATPIVAILRDNSHLERVQAAALGATTLVAADAAASEIDAELARLMRSTTARVVPVMGLRPAQNVEQARTRVCKYFRRSCSQRVG